MRERECGITGGLSQMTVMHSATRARRSLSAYERRSLGEVMQDNTLRCRSFFQYIVFVSTSLGASKTCELRQASNSLLLIQALVLRDAIVAQERRYHNEHKSDAGRRYPNCLQWHKTQEGVPTHAARVWRVLASTKTPVFLRP